MNKGGFPVLVTPGWRKRGSHHKVKEQVAVFPCCADFRMVVSMATVPSLSPILFRFYARDSGLLKFEIQAGLLGRPINHTVRRLVAFTFHPFEPFAISVQRTNAEYVVNFHMRHCCT